MTADGTSQLNSCVMFGYGVKTIPIGDVTMFDDISCVFSITFIGMLGYVMHEAAQALPEWWWKDTVDGESGGGDIISYGW